MLDREGAAVSGSVSTPSISEWATQPRNEWRWHPVERGLPTGAAAVYVTLCVVTQHGSTTPATAHLLAWWTGDVWAPCVTYPCTITHWMRLPEFPS